MKSRLNHSRYIDNGAKAIADRIYAKAKETPTAKQIKFYKRLYAMCKEHSIDTDTGAYARTRGEYMVAIDTLLERLKAANVDINGNGKSGVLILENRQDTYGNYYTLEKIRVNDQQCSTAKGVDE